jgi:hypothetical protein
MEIEIVQRIRKEEADLMRKLKAVRDLLAAYGEPVDGFHRPAPEPVVQREHRAPSAREKVGIEGFGDYGRTIISHAMQAMLTTNHPMKTRRLVEFLAAKKIEITGENKINAVGALLSRSSDITSHGKAGWTLANRETALKIVGAYAHNANGPPGDDFERLLDGPETALHAQDGRPQE